MGLTKFNFLCLCFRKLLRVFRQTIILRNAKKQGWPRYADSTSAFIWSCSMFRKHRPSLSAMNVYILGMCGSTGNWTSNLGSVSVYPSSYTTYMHKGHVVTAVILKRNNCVFLLPCWRVCQYCVLQQKTFFLSLPCEISAQVKERGDIPSWFNLGQTPFWPSRGRHALLPGWPATGPCLLEEPGRYAWYCIDL